MSNYLTENLRTVALVGHGSCGKTSLSEAMLYRTGMISELGSIERGNTMCDNDALEKQVQHSIRLAVAHVDTALPDLTPVRIHVLDTPGYPDYIGQDMSALDAVKSVCAVIDATKGVELLTRRMMDIAKERGLCRMIVINKFDAPDVDLEQLLLDLQEVWGPGVLPINLPANNRSIVIDCFDKDEGEADILSVGEVHRAFIEKIIEQDDEMLEHYLEEGSVDPRTLHPLITKALREGTRLLRLREEPDRHPRLHEGHHPPSSEPGRSQRRSLHPCRRHAVHHASGKGSARRRPGLQGRQ